RDHDHIGLETGLAVSLEFCLEIVRHTRHIDSLLRQAGKDRATDQVLAKETALKIQEELLGLAQFGRVNTKEQVRVIGQSAEKIDIDRLLLSMLLDHSLQNGQLRDAHRLILLRPIRIKTEGGKGAIDARL